MKNNIKTLQILWKNIKPRRQKQLFFLFLLMLISAFCELMSLALILPFLEILNNSDSLNNSDYFRYLPFNTEILDNNNLFLIIIISFLTAFTLSGCFRILTIFFTYRLSALIGNDIGTKAFRIILNLDYQDHLKLDNNKAITCLTEHVRKTQRIIENILSLLISLVISSGIILFLIKNDVNAILIFLFIFGPSYYLINRINNKKVKVVANTMFTKIKLQMKIIRESLFLIREIKTGKLEDNYIYNFYNADKDLKISYGNASFLNQYPRFILEIIAFFSITILALIIKSSSQTSNLLIALGGFALASQRMLPLIQLAYSNWLKLREHAPSLREVVNLIDNYEKKTHKQYIYNKRNLNLGFNKKIEIKNLSFSYKNTKKSVLKNINLIINKGDRIGIVGESGSGKTTLIDLLLGLLNPTSGQILVDNISLKKYLNINHFVRGNSPISYVPQDYFIKEGTFIDNIVYSNNLKKISNI